MFFFLSQSEYGDLYKITLDYSDEVGAEPPQPDSSSPNQPQSASSSWQRALLNRSHSRVTPGSLYRCGRST